MGSAITLILIVVVFVLLIIVPYRRQAQRQREVRAMQAALEPGTEVMTTSGLYGTVVSVQETVVELEIAPGMIIRVARGAIGETVRPQQPALSGESGVPEIEESADPEQNENPTGSEEPDDNPRRPGEDNRP